jgi:hypothetical protein
MVSGEGERGGGGVGEVEVGDGRLSDFRTTVQARGSISLNRPARRYV